MDIKKKILIVDDDEFLLGIHAENFKNEGFEVSIARDGEEAWGIINNGNIPDVIFTGIVMPRMTGFELIAKMKATSNLSKIPVAISSHRNRPEDKKLAQEMAIDDFIVQGFTTPAEVVRRIKMLIGIQNIYKIAIAVDKYDGQFFINLLNKQQGAACDLSDSKEIFLEIEPKTDKGEFKIHIKC